MFKPKRKEGTCPELRVGRHWSGQGKRLVLYLANAKGRKEVKSQKRIMAKFSRVELTLSAYLLRNTLVRKHLTKKKGR